MKQFDGGEATRKMFDRERLRERRRRQRQRVVACCKQLAAFLFSHIGLASMVVAYHIMGGFLFRAIEAPFEQRVKVKVSNFSASSGNCFVVLFVLSYSFAFSSP